MKTISPSLFTRRQAADNGAASGHSSPGAAQTQRFNDLILPHLDGAYNLARYLTRDAVLSEDVVQDAMLRAFRAFAQFRGASPKAWLFAIVRNCCRTAQAASTSGIPVAVPASASDSQEELSRHADPGPTPEDEAARQSDVAWVRSAVEAIPEPFREAVVLRDLEDLSYGEIAEVTGVPVGTVMSRLSRGRAMLAKELLPLAASPGEVSRSVK